MPGRLLAAAVAVAVAGCAAPPPPADPYVQVTPDAGINAEQTIVAADAPLRASIRLVNSTGVDRPVLHTTDWNDAAGMPVPTLLSAPQRLTVPRYGDATIRLIAPTSTAVQFRVRVEPDRSAIDPY
jgi:uncharacterized protein YcfL